MQQETKKIVGFVVEIYELKHYWQTENGYKTVQDWSSNAWRKDKITRYLITPDCYKRTYLKKFNSVHKLNKALGLKNGKSYWFYKSLEEAIKSAYGENFYRIKNNFNEVLVVRQIHNLDQNYTF